MPDVSTTVAPSESKWLPLPQYMCEVTVSAVLAPGETGSGSFHFRVPAIESDYTVTEGEPWSLAFQNLGVVDAFVTNTGTTTLVFTSPDGS